MLCSSAGRGFEACDTYVLVLPPASYHADHASDASLAAVAHEASNSLVALAHPSAVAARRCRALEAALASFR